MGDKIYFGSAIIDKQDLAETNINHSISVEYYRIEEELKKKFSFIGKKAKVYGIEVVKKDYFNKSIPSIENYISEYMTKNIKEINSIIETLKSNKVLPVHTDEVIQDLRWIG